MESIVTLIGYILLSIFLGTMLMNVIATWFVCISSGQHLKATMFSAIIAIILVIIWRVIL